MIADGRKNRLEKQPSIVDVDQDRNGNNLGPEGEQGEGEQQEGGSQGGDQVGGGQEGGGRVGGVGGGREGEQILRRLPVVKSLGDKVLKAEVVWVLKTVESNFSFNASEDIVEVLQQMDPESIVLKTMRIKRHKVSYILTHGLYPYYKEKLVRRIQGAVGFTLGTDSATFKLNGLSKFVDIVIRWGNS